MDILAKSPSLCNQLSSSWAKTPPAAASSLPASSSYCSTPTITSRPQPPAFSTKPQPLVSNQLNTKISRTATSSNEQVDSLLNATVVDRLLLERNRGLKPSTLGGMPSSSLPVMHHNNGRVARRRRRRGRIVGSAYSPPLTLDKEILRSVLEAPSTLAKKRTYYRDMKK